VIDGLGLDVKDEDIMSIMRCELREIKIKIMYGVGVRNNIYFCQLF